VRRTLRGTAERPRLSVYRSNQHIYAQVIDDAAGRTLAHASDVEGDLRGEQQTKTSRAEAVGRRIAQRAKEAGLEAVVFDRGGFKYAGRVQALASAARDEGLVF
jgi:large subunit ribosomal protein L18